MGEVAKVEGVRVIYKATAALDGVSAAFGHGEFVALIGPSGAGKSTLLRCLNRLIEPAAGRIFFKGKDITHITGGALREIRREIGMIFQNFNLVKRYPVMSNALIGRLGYLPSLTTSAGAFPGNEVERAGQTLERVGLSEKIHEKAGNLSGGQQQRVAIARALMQSPVLMLADEPVSSLDMATAEVILDLLKDINRREGVTVVASLHDVMLAKRYATRIVGLRRGRVHLDAPPTEWSADRIQELYWGIP